MPFSQEESQFRIHSASIVASKFAGFQSSWLVCGGGGGIVQEKVYKGHAINLDDLKHRIRTEWAKLDHAVKAAVHQWRLSARVNSGGGHLEHCCWFWHFVCGDNCYFPCCRWPVEQLHIIGRFGSIAVVTVSNSQGKVATLIRWGKLLLIVSHYLLAISCKKLQCLNLSKTCPKQCRSLFSRTRCICRHKSITDK